MTLVSSSSSSSSPVLFSARKLSEVDVAVQTADGAGVPAVVVSISSDAVRTNNRTDDAGHVHFYALPPGEYYIRPALKEYIFEPASQVSQSARKRTRVVDGLIVRPLGCGKFVRRPTSWTAPRCPCRSAPCVSRTASLAL